MQSPHNACLLPERLNSLQRYRSVDSVEMDDVGFPDGSLKLASALVSEQTDRGIKVRVSNEKVIRYG